AIANAFGGEIGDGATATVTDTPVSADGLVKVDALADATILSSIGNQTSASGTGFQGRRRLALGPGLSMNPVSSAANAAVDFAGTNLPAQTVSGAGVEVTADDNAHVTATTTLVSDTKFNGITNPNQVKSTAVAGTASLNDVHGGAHALLGHATISAPGNEVQVEGTERAVIQTTQDVKADTSGIQFGGNDKSLAIGAIITTNVVRSDATATLTGGNVTTADTVTVSADNTAIIKADLTNEVKTHSDTAKGLALTLAFNSIGWKGQNVLFNTIDALLGDPLISNALGGTVASGAHAFLTDTPVTADGAVTVSATNGQT